jgi:hypothetical protein
MRRGLPSFGTVWHHPKMGGSTLFLAKGCGEATGFWPSWEQGCARTLDRGGRGGGVLVTFEGGFSQW